MTLGLTWKVERNIGEFYRSLDLDFLRRTGNGETLEKHHAEYINVTECVWNDDCVPSEIITKELSSIGYVPTNPVFASYLPKRIYDLRTKATIISLAKIKSQFHDPAVGFSGTIKNIFGLLPDPSRMKYHVGENMMGLDTALADIFLLFDHLSQGKVDCGGYFQFFQRTFFAESDDCEKSKYNIHG